MYSAIENNDKNMSKWSAWHVRLDLLDQEGSLKMDSWSAYKVAKEAKGRAEILAFDEKEMKDVRKDTLCFPLPFRLPEACAVFLLP